MKIVAVFGSVCQAAALVLLLYLPDMKPSSELDHTVAHSSLRVSAALSLPILLLAQGERLSDWIDSNNGG